MSDLRFLLRRAIHHWTVLLTLSLGVVLATALLASGPVLIDTVIAFALRRTLLDAEPLDAHLRLTATQNGHSASYDTLDTHARALIEAQFGPWIETIIAAGETQWAHPWIEGTPVPDEQVNLRFYGTRSQLRQHAELVAGQWPVRARSEERVVSAVVPQVLAQAYALQVDSRLPLSVKETAPEPGFWIEVAGIARALEIRDPFWFGDLSPIQPRQDARHSARYGVWVPEASPADMGADLLGSSRVDLSWNVLLNPATLQFEDALILQRRIAALDGDPSLSNAGLRMWTRLGNTLERFIAQAEAIRAPLYLLIATVVVLALYYVTLVSALALRQTRREFAILRSRGASGWHLLYLQLLEAALIGAIALASGPLLARLWVRGLVLWGPLNDISRPEWALALPQAAWLAALVGAVACTVGLVAPVPAALRWSIVAWQQSRARPSRPPWWQRFYVDVIALCIGVILLWRLRVYGSILGTASGPPRVDWLLLLAPLALLVGSATVLLRIFPLLLRAGARLLEGVRGLTVPLALWQSARDPMHITRLVLLLTLSMTLGLFASGLNVTLDRNERDCSQYAVGSDLRFVDLRPGDSTEIGAEQPSSSAWRGSGSLTLELDRRHPFLDVLALDPDTFLSVSQTRPDFAARPMPELVDALGQPQVPTPPSIELPGTPARLILRTGVIAHMDGSVDWLDMRVQVSPDAGTSMVPLQVVNVTRDDSEREDANLWWITWEGAMPEAKGPAGLYAIWFRSSGRWYTPMWWMLLDDLIVVDGRSGEHTQVDAFGDSPPRWSTHLPDPDLSFQALDDERQLLIGFGEDGITQEWYCLQPGPEPAIVMPALISPRLQQVAQAEVGDRIGAWIDSVPTEFEVVGVVNHFPTMYEQEEAGFVVTSHPLLLQHLNRARIETTHTNELFLADAPGEASSGTWGIGTQILEAETIRRAIKSDPLALGLRSVTLFGYLLTSVLSLAGFGAHFYQSVRQRTGHYGILRALGLAPGQLYISLLLEQVLLVISGLGLGTVLGLLLNQLTLPGLPLSLGGWPAVPPFRAQTDWRAVGTIWGTLSLAFLVSLSIATGLLWRTKLHQTLRVDEE